MKPSWSDAPEWANYLAMDEDGSWYWHEKEPSLKWEFEWASIGRVTRCDKISGWRDTLEFRPLAKS